MGGPKFNDPMVSTDYPNGNFAYFGFFWNRFNNSSKLNRCSISVRDLYEMESLYNLCFHGRMSCCFLKEFGERHEEKRNYASKCL